MNDGFFVFASIKSLYVNAVIKSLLRSVIGNMGAD